MTRAGRSTPRRSSRGTGWEAWVELGTDATAKRVRRHVRGGTRTEVSTRIAELEAQRSLGGGAYAGPMPTVDEWMRTWVEGRALEVRPSTMKGYCTDLRLISASIGRIRLDRLGPEDVERFWLPDGNAEHPVGALHGYLDPEDPVPPWARGPDPGLANSDTARPSSGAACVLNRQGRPTHFNAPLNLPSNNQYSIPGEVVRVPDETTAARQPPISTFSATVTSCRLLSQT